MMKEAWDHSDVTWCSPHPSTVSCEEDESERGNAVYVAQRKIRGLNPVKKLGSMVLGLYHWIIFVVVNREGPLSNKNKYNNLTALQFEMTSTNFHSPRVVHSLPPSSLYVGKSKMVSENIDRFHFFFGRECGVYDVDYLNAQIYTNLLVAFLLPELPYLATHLFTKGIKEASPETKKEKERCYPNSFKKWGKFNSKYQEFSPSRPLSSSSLFSPSSSLSLSSPSTPPPSSPSSSRPPSFSFLSSTPPSVTSHSKKDSALSFSFLSSTPPSTPPPPSPSSPPFPPSFSPILPFPSPDGEDNPLYSVLSGLVPPPPSRLFSFFEGEGEGEEEEEEERIERLTRMKDLEWPILVLKYHHIANQGKDKNSKFSLSSFGSYFIKENPSFLSAYWATQALLASYTLPLPPSPPLSILPSSSPPPFSITSTSSSYSPTLSSSSFTSLSSYPSLPSFSSFPSTLLYPEIIFPQWESDLFISIQNSIESELLGFLFDLKVLLLKGRGAFLHVAVAELVMFCCVAGKVLCVEMLVREFAIEYFNPSDSTISCLNVADGMTGFRPLHMAVILGNKKLISLLIELGADWSAMDWMGRTPIHLAKETQHALPESRDVVEMLDGISENWIESALRDLRKKATEGKGLEKIRLLCSCVENRKVLFHLLWREGTRQAGNLVLHEKIDMEDIELGKLIGAGSFGKVAEGKWKKKKVAVKFIDENDPDFLVEHVKTEQLVLSLLSHPNIVPFHGSGAYKSNNPPSSGVFLVMDLMDGNLRSLLTSSLSLDTLLIIEQIAVGLDYIHQHDLIHRDIKPENILFCVATQSNVFSQKKEENLSWKELWGQGEITIKLTDFGITKFSHESTNVFKTACGTDGYMAPEVLTSRCQAKYNSKIDIWGLGIIWWEIIHRIPPVVTVSASPLLFEEEIVCKYPPEMVTLIEDCLNIGDPKKRPIARQIIEKVQQMRKKYPPCYSSPRKKDKENEKQNKIEESKGKEKEREKEEEEEEKEEDKEEEEKEDKEVVLRKLEQFSKLADEILALDLTNFEETEEYKTYKTKLNQLTLK